MLFSRPEGKVVSRLGVLISRIARFCPVFHRIIRFYALLYLYQKWIAENIRWISGAILGVGETINAAYTGAVANDRNSDEGN